MLSNVADQIAEIQAKLNKYNSFLAEDPTNLNLLAEIIDLNIHLKNYSQAKEKVIEALNIESDNPYFKLRLSTILIAEADYEASIEITTKLIQDNFIALEIKFNHGYALALNAQYEEAKEYLFDIYNNEHSFQLLPATLVRTLHHLGEIDEAILIAERHIQNYPTDAPMLGMLSLLYFDNDDFTNAQLYADKTLALTPENLDALMTTGGSYIANERIIEATELLVKASKIYPENGRVWIKLGLIDMLNQDLDSAKTNINKAISFMPDHIGSWHVLGWIQIMNQDIHNAEISFNHALELDRNFGETYGGLAIVEALKGNWTKADEYSKLAKKLSGNVMSTYYIDILKLQGKRQANETAELIKTIMNAKKLPNGKSFQDFLNTISNRN